MKIYDHSPVKLVYIERSYLDAFADNWPGFRSLVEGVNHIACAYEHKTGDLLDMDAYDTECENREVDLSHAEPGSGLSEIIKQAWQNALAQGDWNSQVYRHQHRLVTEYLTEDF